MKNKYQITNDFRIDAIKDNYKVPKMGEIKYPEVEELFERLQINFDFFKDYVYHHSERFGNGEDTSYYIKDVAKVIRHLFNIEQIIK